MTPGEASRRLCLLGGSESCLDCPLTRTLAGDPLGVDAALAPVPGCPEAPEANPAAASLRFFFSSLRRCLASSLVLRSPAWTLSCSCGFVGEGEAPLPSLLDGGPGFGALLSIPGYCPAKAGAGPPAPLFSRDIGGPLPAVCLTRVELTDAGRAFRPSGVPGRDGDGPLPTVDPVACWRFGGDWCEPASRLVAAAGAAAGLDGNVFRAIVVWEASADDADKAGLLETVSGLLASARGFGFSCSAFGEDGECTETDGIPEASEECFGPGPAPLG